MTNALRRQDRVDLVLLTRDPTHLDAEVEQGILHQCGVHVCVHRVVGAPLPGETCRWETISRVRNEGKSRGDTPWLMFLDEDVVLEERCVATLLSALRSRPAFGALASNYLGETAWTQSPHVAMGATLFKREALGRIRFRYTEDRCECQCCCDDLRRQLYGIDYLSRARSRHLATGDMPRMHGQVVAGG